MAYGVGKVYAFTMGATSASASVNLQASFNKVYLQVPSMVSNSALDLYGSVDGTNYYQLQNSIPHAQSFVVTMASADSIASFNLGRLFSKIYIQIGSMNSSANLNIQASLDNVTFYDLRSVSPTTQAVQSTFVVAASATGNGCIVPYPQGVQYLRVVADSAPSIAVGFKVVGYDPVPQLMTCIIGAKVTVNGVITPIPEGFQFYKVVATDSAPTAALTFNIIGSDY